MAEPITLLIVDDHPVVRDGIRGLFAGDADFEVVGEAADGREAVARTEALRPTVVLMDLHLPVLGGVDATRTIVERDLARVLVVTTYDSDDDVLPAIAAGATGYVLKDAPRDELRRAVRAAAAGESVLSPPIARRLLTRVREPAGGPLSERELEILSLVAAGATNKDVAARLFISEATVKTHLLHVYEKLGVHHRAAAVAVAYDRALLPRPDPG
ncbi:MAG: response regulator transcription factor [Actinomycetota bacterium]|nr:response regulator transcription factor [Actinomycetota bacterium]